MPFKQQVYFNTKWYYYGFLSKVFLHQHPAKPYLIIFILIVLDDLHCDFLEWCRLGTPFFFNSKCGGSGNGNILFGPMTYFIKDDIQKSCLEFSGHPLFSWAFRQSSLSTFAYSLDMKSGWYENPFSIYTFKL